MQFQGAEELNALVANAVKEVLKPNKRAKDTAEHDSGLEEEPKNFNSKNLRIWEERNNVSGKRQNEAKFQGKSIRQYKD